MKTSPQTTRNGAAAPAWLWLPSGQGESPGADPVVWEVDESPSSVSQASVTPECVYDQSIKVMAMLPTLSPQSALAAEYPLSTPFAVFAALSPPEADSPLKRHAILQHDSPSWTTMMTLNPLDGGPLS